MSYDTTPLRRAAALLPRPDLSLLCLHGRDHLAFLQRMLSNDVAKLASGDGRPTALLTSKSQVVCTLECLRADDAVWAIVPSAQREGCAEALDRFIIADDVEVDSPPDACLALYGRELASLDALGELAALNPYAHRRGSVNGVDVLAVGDDSLGVPGLLLFVPPEQLDPLREQLVGDGVVEVDPGLWETARVEVGLPRMGAELSEHHLLLEGGQLGRVDFEKGCYIGQEPVCRIHFRGQVNRRLVGLKLAAGSVPGALPTSLSHPDKAEAGLLTSLVDSAAAGGTVGLGYVHRKFATAGTRLAASEGVEVEVVDLPHVPLDRVPQTFPRYKDDSQ